MDKLILYFSFPFVRYALIVGIFISLCASLLGVPLVLKRFSFIGDGLSHVAFGAMAVAAVMSINNQMLVILPVTVIAAVLLLQAGQNTKLRGDASIAVLSVSAMGVGYLLMNVFRISGNVSGDVCSTLFGATAILTLSRQDVWLCISLSIVVTLAFVLLYHKIFSVTFDENFAEASGVNAKLYNMFIAIITAVIIVLAMKLVGTLLISALIIFPALSAMRVFKSFRKVIICAAFTSILCSSVGIVVSILASTPIGSTIVAANLTVFIIFVILGRVLKTSV